MLVVGLANPGAEFDGTRHNVGGDAVVEFAHRHGARLRADKRSSALVGDARIDGTRVVLAVPTTYMNDSGRAVVVLARRAGIDIGDGDELAARLVVVHDELDLPPGRLKVKVGGGDAGHNGLRSVDQHLHARGYTRVRIGIGKPPGRQAGADYVLRRPGRAERELLAVAVAEAADAVEVVVREGAETAMNRFNVRA